MAKSLETLKTEAAQLGIEVPEGMKATELQKIIDAKYDELEAQDASVSVDAVALPEVETVVKTLGQMAAEAEKKARKTRIIMVFDNDNRENSETTVAVVNCSNQYFDLGTVYIPLGDKVEVMQGHIDVLKDIEIPHHMKVGDQTKTLMRKRYTISYEDGK